jgi:sortase (surface protein transpeptidase)
MKKLFVGTVVVIAGIVFATTAVHSVWYNPETPASSTPLSYSSSAPASPADDPSQLIIPALGINAHVQYLGINTMGNMMAPDNFTDVGWYKYGPAPGQPGSAVIDGHVDNGLGLAGVFKKLNQLAVGEDVYIQTKSGTRLHFVVSDIESYPYTAAPASSIFTKTGDARLAMITCEGTWVPGGDTYDHRLVVFSKLVP